MVKTDQQSLKFLLTQKLGTPAQQQWVSKLFGYDFVVEYCSGVTNVLADALFKQQQGEVATISIPKLDWLEELKHEQTHDLATQAILQDLKGGRADLTRFTEQNGLLFYKGRFVILAASPFWFKILEHVHNSPMGEHEGYHKNI